MKQRFNPLFNIKQGVLQYKKGGKRIMISPILTNKHENRILELIDNQAEYTRSDLQAVVSALVNTIMEDGYRIISDQKNAK